MLRPTDENDGALISQMAAARRATDALFAQVPAHLLYERPIAERHRIAFYIGHLEAFDANLLQLQATADAPLRRLFAFGIDPIGGALPSDSVHDWPSMSVIGEFVAGTRKGLDRRLMSAPPTTIDGISLTTLLHTAVEHRWMHAETLAYLINRLPVDKPIRLGVRPNAAAGIGTQQMVPVPAGEVTLGRQRDDGFGWDNEYGCIRQQLTAFEIDRFMVSNAQFAGFIDDGGYNEPRWWTQDDWHWRMTHAISHPAAWTRQDGQWYLMSWADRVPFQGDWPVYVSHAEASAYARWCGKSLPTEAQWQRAAYGTGDSAERVYPWGDESPSPERGHFEFAGWDPMAVDSHPAGASEFGVEGMLGNGWEWTSTVFAPFEGFEPFSFYRGYSADFFDGRHFVQKGGSAHTARALLRRSFRNWFQPHYPYSFAGFRCVRSA